MKRSMSKIVNITINFIILLDAVSLIMGMRALYIGKLSDLTLFIVVFSNLLTILLGIFLPYPNRDKISEEIINKINKEEKKPIMPEWLDYLIFKTMDMIFTLFLFLLALIIIGNLTLLLFLGLRDFTALTFNN